MAIGSPLSAALPLSIVAAKKLDRLQIALILCAALYFGALIYALAVDPRPRMFFPIIVIAAALIGSLASKLWVWPYKIVIVTFIVMIPATALLNVVRRTDYSEAAAAADQLLAQRPYQVTTNARQRLALIRQEFPAGGVDLIEIEKRCPPRIAGRWLAHREGRLCIYRSFPWPFEPYRNGVQGTDRELTVRRLPNRC